MSFKNKLHRLLKKPFFGRFQKPWIWPDSIDKADWRPLKIASKSGAELSALVGETTLQNAKGAILLAHPMGLTAKGFWLKYGHAALLREAGYHVMVFDFNGFGESENTNMEFPLDVLSAGLHLQELYSKLSIGIVGSSMGGAMSICAMAYPNHPFKAAVIESAFPTLMHFWGRFRLPKIALLIVKCVHPKGERRLRPLNASKNLFNNPKVLLIYGDKDEHTPANDGRELYRALLEKVDTDFWLVHNADHTHAFGAAPAEYAERVIGFFDYKMAHVNHC